MINVEMENSKINQGNWKSNVFLSFLKKTLKLKNFFY